MAESIAVDRATLERAAAALAAYMGAMRADIPARETIIERIRAADRKAQPVYAELYALLHQPQERSECQSSFPGFCDWPECACPRGVGASLDAQDAARYRWLRATTNHITSKGQRIALTSPEELDAAIDRQLASSAGEARPLRWAVFCRHCRKEWSVDYEHPGGDVCEACARGVGIPGEGQQCSD